MSYSLKPPLHLIRLNDLLGEQFDRLQCTNGSGTNRHHPRPPSLQPDLRRPRLPARRSQRLTPSCASPSPGRDPGQRTGHRHRHRHARRCRPRRHHQPHPLRQIRRAHRNFRRRRHLHIHRSTRHPVPPHHRSPGLRPLLFPRVHPASRRIFHPARPRTQNLRQHHRQRRRLQRPDRPRPGPRAGKTTRLRRLPELLHQLHLGRSAHARQAEIPPRL